MRIKINEDEREYLLALLIDISNEFENSDCSSIQEDVELVECLIKKLIGKGVF